MLRREPCRVRTHNVCARPHIACVSFGKGHSYVGMTLAIIVLISRPEAPWIAALHRFGEVSLGILVALAVVVVWREEQDLGGKTIAE